MVSLEASCVESSARRAEVTSCMIFDFPLVSHSTSWSGDPIKIALSTVELNSIDMFICSSDSTRV